MNRFRFIRKNWDDEVVRDYLAGAVYNAVLYAAGKEENGDYIVRFRAGGGGVYIAYWEEECNIHWPGKGLGMSRVAHVQVGGCSIKPVSWKLSYSEADLAQDLPAILYWCPRSNGMPFINASYRTYFREWCLYEGVYKWARQRGWNPEGDDGRPSWKLHGEPRRSLVVDRMLEASKQGGGKR